MSFGFSQPIINEFCSEYFSEIEIYIDKAISFVDGESCLIELIILGYASNSILMDLLFLEEILSLDGLSILKSEGAADAK